jgi:hypothetical protein
VVTIELLNQALAGRYRVSEEIGRGAMAAVYWAHDTSFHSSIRARPAGS